MAIIDNGKFLRLKTIEKWFEDQASKDPAIREKSPFVLDNKLKTHRTNLIKIAKELLLKMAKNTPKFTFKGFVNVDLTTQHHGDAQKFISDDKAVWQQFNTALLDGYDLKLSRDDEKDHFRCSMTCKDPESDNYGYSMGGWAKDWYTALAVTLFKHFDVLEENWTEYTNPDENAFG